MSPTLASMRVVDGVDQTIGQAQGVTLARPWRDPNSL